MEDYSNDRLDTASELNLNEWTWRTIGASATILAIYGIIHTANQYTPPEERFGAPSKSVDEVIVEEPTALLEEPYLNETNERVVTLPAYKMFDTRHGVFSYVGTDGTTWHGIDQRDLGMELMLEVMSKDNDGVVWYQVK